MTPKILLVSLTNDVGAERITVGLTEHGAHCATLSPRGFYASRTRHCSVHFSLPGNHGMWLSALAAHSSLERVARTWAPDILVPLDDVAAWLMRGLATSKKTSPRLRDLIVKSIGSPAGYRACINRLDLMQAAAEQGIRVPKFAEADTAATVDKFADESGYPVVMKSEFTCGGHGVSIVRSATDLNAKFEEATHPRANVVRRLRAFMRMAMWRQAGIPCAHGLPPLLQAYVGGRPAMHTLCAWGGHVLQGASFVAEHVHPEPTGSSTLVRHIEHEEMAAAAAALTAKLGCSGFVSFDFMLDDTGQSFLIEMNSRPIATSHLGVRFGHDLCGALVARLRGEQAWSPRFAIPEQRMIALFPKELERDPTSPHALRSDAVIHDVPMQDPSLIAAYLERFARIHPDNIDSVRRLLLPMDGPPAADGNRARRATRFLSAVRPSRPVAH
jgi:hypothetical protein